MKCNTKVLGSAMLAAGPLIVNFGPVPAAWWLGFLFTTLGPFMIAFEFHEPKKPRRKKSDG